MNTFTAGIIFFVLLFVVLFLKFPISWSMLLIGFVGYSLLVGLDSGLTVFGRVPFTTFASYELGVIPLFMLMGFFFLYSGFGTDLYTSMYKWFGRLPGGLGMTTIAACAAFGAICGSAAATVATIGTVALPEMKRYNYDPALSTGIVAGGANLGILIPPSIIMVIYGMLTENSIGVLFIAGFIPGLLLAALFMLTIYIQYRRNPQIAPRGESSTLKEKFATLKTAWVVIFLFLLVIIGIYRGIFTPTEAASVGAFLAMVIGLARRKLPWKAFKGAVRDTVNVTGMIFCGLVGGYVLSYFLAVTKIPMWLAGFIGGLQVAPMVVMIGILALMFLLGCFIDGIILIILMIPILYPSVIALGFDPIWFGVIVVMITAVGLMTPPIGANVFLTTLIAKDVPMYTVFRGVTPFVIASIVFTAILCAAPVIATFLPQLMYGIGYGK